MPIYEYLCDTCGKRFEYLARTLIDAPLYRHIPNFPPIPFADIGCTLPEGRFQK